MKILLLLAAAGLLYILQDWIYKTLWDKNLSVSIHFQDKAVLEGEQATLTEVIETRQQASSSTIERKTRYNCLLGIIFKIWKIQAFLISTIKTMFFLFCFTREYEERLSSPVKSADTMRLHNLISSHPIYL